MVKKEDSILAVILKTLLMLEKISVAKFIIIKKGDKLVEKRRKINQAIKRFHFPFFIKPVSLGSSVGISKVFNKKEIKSRYFYSYQEK